MSDLELNAGLGKTKIVFAFLELQSPGRLKNK